MAAHLDLGDGIVLPDPSVAHAVPCRVGSAPRSAGAAGVPGAARSNGHGDEDRTEPGLQGRPDRPDCAARHGWFVHLLREVPPEIR